MTTNALLGKTPNAHRPMYSPEAEQLRRCTATTRNGRPCKAWALWNGPHQLCSAHAGHTTGPHNHTYRHQHANYPPCHCNAYPFAHRPASGTCNWPHTSTPQLAQTTHSETRTDAHAGSDALCGADEAGDEPGEDPGGWRDDGTWDEALAVGTGPVSAAASAPRRLAFGSVLAR